MPKFSVASKNKLMTCHKDLQTLFNEVIKYFDCTILVGMRGRAEQEIAFKNGNSKLNWPDSKHNANPSFAVDAAPYPIPDWKNVSDFVYFAGFVKGIARILKMEGKMSYDIRYGGDFNQNDRISDSRFFDLIHFELV